MVAQAPRKRRAVNAVLPRDTSVRFYVLFATTVSILVAFEALLTSLPFADAIPDYAAALEQRQLDAYLEMIRLLVTLATLAMGGITGFIVNHGRTNLVTGRQRRRAIASWVLCAASLYFGYLAHQQVVWMLNNGFFNPTNPRVWIPTRAQFWSFLACVVVFADFAYGTLKSSASGPGGEALHDIEKAV